MRSNDLWLGTTYDVMQFVMLQASIASVLKAGVGKYVHTAGSLHLYERDWDKARAVTPSNEPGRRKLYPVSFGSVDHMMKTADRWLRGGGHEEYDGWYIEELTPYLG